jgi:CheY-like chemotaxis protein
MKDTFPIVLLVEDSSTRVLVTTIEEGVLTIRTSQANLAYEIARATRPDLIAVDASLHGGWAVCRLFKRDPLTAPIPVVVVNAVDGPETAAHARYAGAAAVFTHPTPVSDWFSAVRGTVAATSAA